MRRQPLSDHGVSSQDLANPFADLIQLRAKTQLFLNYIGIGKEEIIHWEIFPLLKKVRTFIEGMVKKNGEPPAASSRRTYAAEILSAIGRLRNEDLFKMPAVKSWMTVLDTEAGDAPVNRAPIVDREEVIKRALEMTPPHLWGTTRAMIELMWVTMARSADALKGLAWIGNTGDQWRFSWHTHKTKRSIGAKDVWISDHELPSQLKIKLRNMEPMLASVFHPDTVDELSPIIRKALGGRNLSIRRSSAQDTMYHNPDLERLRARTNHTNTKTLSRYLATRLSDLKPHASSSAKSQRTTTTSGKKR